ncbi:MAG: diguanylate cyclase [Peptococcaceae bacterium]|nr:diguanylate cyclase [Peptococcaceae bacterium]
MAVFTVLLATGNNDLDKELRKALSDAGVSFAGDPVYYREALESPGIVKDAAVVVLSTSLAGSLPLRDLIFRLRSRDVRVVLLVGDSVEIGDAAVGMGVYDLIDDPVDPADVVERVLHPATFASVVDGRHPGPSGVAVPGVPADEHRVAAPPAGRGLTAVREAIRRLKGKTFAAGTVDLSGLKVWSNFPLPAAKPFDGVPAASGDAVLIKAAPGAAELVRKLRRDKTFLAVPVIVVGSSDATYLDAGADGCVPELTAGTVRDIGRMRKRLKELWAESETDALTGCRTRGFLDTYVRELGQRPSSVLMCDLDHFKLVNDTHGHAAGDEVLKRFGAFLRGMVRETDVCVRYGGEEFVVILPGVSVERAAVLSEKICFGWREQVTETDAGPIRSTVSIGVSGPGGPGADAVKDADKALYSAKNAGRDRVTRFDRIAVEDDRKETSGCGPRDPVETPGRQVHVPVPVSPLVKTTQGAGTNTEREEGGRVRLPSLVKIKKEVESVVHRERSGPACTPPRILAFSAPHRGCGATTVAIAAARALSGDFEVVAIDCDFKNPSLGFRLGLPVGGVDCDWRVNGLGAMKSVDGIYLLPLDMTRQGTDDLRQYLDEIRAFIREGIIVIDAGQDVQVVPGALKIGVIDGDNLDSYVRMYDHLILNRAKGGSGLRNVLGVIPYQSMAEIDLSVKRIFGERKEVIPK